MSFKITQTLVGLEARIAISGVWLGDDISTTSCTALRLLYIMWLPRLDNIRITLYRTFIVLGFGSFRNCPVRTVVTMDTLNTYYRDGKCKGKFVLN